MTSTWHGHIPAVPRLARQLRMTLFILHTSPTELRAKATEHLGNEQASIPG